MSGCLPSDTSGSTGAGSTVTDLSPEGNHGTIVGSGMTAVTSGVPFGQALHFSGTNAVDVNKALFSTTNDAVDVHPQFLGGILDEHNVVPLTVVRRGGFRHQIVTARPPGWLPAVEVGANTEAITSGVGLDWGSSARRVVRSNEWSQ